MCVCILTCAIEKMEDLVRRYSRRRHAQGNAHSLAEDIRVSSLEALLPDDLEKHVRARLTSYGVLREEIKTYCVCLPGSWRPCLEPDLPRTGIFGMFMNKVFFAFPSATCNFVQICGSIFSAFNLLISRALKEENSSLDGLPKRSSGCSRFPTLFRWLSQSSDPLQNLHGVPTSSHMTQTSTD